MIYSRRDNELDDHYTDKLRDDAMDDEFLAMSLHGLVALLIPGRDNAGRAVGQDDLNRRLDSGRLLLGHVLANPRVVSVASSSSVLDDLGYPVVDRCWLVFCLAWCTGDQWVKLSAGANQLSRLYGQSVGLVGPYGRQGLSSFSVSKGV